jgi:hypothetical protein
MSADITDMAYRLKCLITWGQVLKSSSADALKTGKTQGLTH